MWKEALVAKFDISFWQLPAWNEENKEDPQDNRLLQVLSQDLPDTKVECWLLNSEPSSSVALF
jgi:hypothetical protein